MQEDDDGALQRCHDAERGDRTRITRGHDGGQPGRDGCAGGPGVGRGGLDRLQDLLHGRFGCIRLSDEHDTVAETCNQAVPLLDTHMWLLLDHSVPFPRPHPIIAGNHRFATGVTALELPLIGAAGTIR